MQNDEGIEQDAVNGGQVEEEDADQAVVENPRRVSFDANRITSVEARTDSVRPAEVRRMYNMLNVGEVGIIYGADFKGDAQRREDVRQMLEANVIAWTFNGMRENTEIKESKRPRVNKRVLPFAENLREGKNISLFAMDDVGTIYNQLDISEEDLLAKAHTNNQYNWRYTTENLHPDTDENDHGFRSLAFASTSNRYTDIQVSVENDDNGDARGANGARVIINLGTAGMYAMSRAFRQSDIGNYTSLKHCGRCEAKSSALYFEERNPDDPGLWNRVLQTNTLAVALYAHFRDREWTIMNEEEEGAEEEN